MESEDTLEELTNKEQDIIDKQIENNIESFKVSIELSLDLS
jgi:hypothetical protein